MIIEFDSNKLDQVMKIWLETNIYAHHFISKDYWEDNYSLVKQMLPSAEIYLFEEDNVIKGFIGMAEGNYIAGLFVKKEYQRKGIGQELIEFCKAKYKNLALDVYMKNKNAINFYYKNLFKIADEHMNKETNEIGYTMSFAEK